MDNGLGIRAIAQALANAAMQPRQPTGMEKSTFGIDYGVPDADPRSAWFKDGNRLNTMTLHGSPGIGVQRLADQLNYGGLPWQAE